MILILLFTLRAIDCVDDIQSAFAKSPASKVAAAKGASPDQRIDEARQQRERKL
jgi:hypothetical protein